jgi:hypothetical protein
MTQGILTNTRCYLSGHMEYAEGRVWREDVKTGLADLDIVFLDPFHKPFATSFPEDDETRAKLIERKHNGTVEDFEYLNQYMRQVRSDDLRLCDIADFSIAHIIPKVASWGTAEELTTLNRMKKPIFLSVEGGKKHCPLWIFGMLKHTYIYNNVDEIMSMVRRIHTGEVKIDSTKWRLLNHEMR